MAEILRGAIRIKDERYVFKATVKLASGKIRTISATGETAAEAHDNVLKLANEREQRS